MKRNVITLLLFSAVIISTVLFSCNTNRFQVSSLGMKMINILPGSFMMGDSSGDWDEIPVHKVHISKSFYISETEVTAKQFQEFKKDYRYSHEEFAVGVSWYEANEFCNWLSDREGKNYRLPTESEWENGKIKSESRWKNMKCNGIAKYIDYKGKLIKEVTFINGKIIK